MESTPIQLLGKLRLRGHILIETGLHIGGTSEALEIGTLNLDVVKTPKGVPYIPGSSLKGKLRSMLAYREGSPQVEKDGPLIKALFGDSGDKQEKGIRGRLIVRDAYLDTDHFHQTFDRDRDKLHEPYTEHKTENRIKRSNGAAEHPRTQARVPKGARFAFTILFDAWGGPGMDQPFTTGLNRELMDELLVAMRLLEDDYLGGSGSRGYGHIRFIRDSLVFEVKAIADYEDPDGDWTTISDYELSTQPIAS